MGHIIHIFIRGEKMKETKEIVHDAIENAIIRENTQKFLSDNDISPKTLEKNLPKPYLWLTFRRYFLWHGVIKGTLIALALPLIAFAITQNGDSIVVGVVAGVSIFYWLLNFFVNFAYIMSLKTSYNQNEEECMEELKRLFPNAVEK